MKHITLATLILLTFACCRKYEQALPLAYDKIDPYLDVITLAGQSNMAGKAEALQAEMVPMTDSNDMSVHIMSYGSYGAARLRIMTPGVNSADRVKKIGIQTFLGKSLLNQKRRNIYLFQPALSGTAINQWQEGGMLWKYITDGIPYIKEFARMKGKTARFKDAVWFQGETNALLPTWDSSYYRKALEDFIVRYRSITGYDTRFIIMQFPTCFTNIKPQHLLEIRDVQRKVGSQRNNVLVPYEVTDGCAGDGIHLDRETYEKKAEAIYKIIH